MAERPARKEKARLISPETKSESTVTGTSPLSRLPTGDHLDAAQTELKRRGSEISKISEGFAGTTDSINQLIPPAGCTPPTAADLLKSKGNHSIGEVDACNPVEFATTIVSEKKEEET